MTELGRYRLVRHLAKGGMGEVYLAEATGAAGFAKRVVIKVLRPDLAADAQLVAQLVAEGRLLEALDHPNIAHILDIGQQGDVFWLAMEYVEGADLRALLRALPTTGDGKNLSPAAVLHVVASVARALEHAQTRRGPDGAPLAIVHHDVSPSNVMVRRDGHVKLVDFGVARAAVLGKLSAGALRGKLPYLSPEHAQQKPVDGRADLFALGLVALELLSGERALDITEPTQLEAAHARLPARVASLQGRGVPADLCTLIAELTELDLRQRCPDAATVADRAERLLVQLGEASPARTLATALVPAFDLIESRSGSFDQTLAGILGLADAPQVHDFTGTLSLPGLDVISVAAASARDEGSPTTRRWRKRWIWLGLAVLSAAIGIGFWAGQRNGARGQDNGPAPVAVIEAPPLGPAAPAVATAERQPASLPPPTVAMPDAANARDASQPSAATAQGEAAAGPATPTTTGAESDDSPHAKAKPREAKAERSATIRFRVQPFACRVSVDGEVRKPAGQSDRYEVHVTAGDHKIRVADPGSGQVKDIWVRGLHDGEERILPGGICLGEGCPEAGAP